MTLLPPFATQPGNAGAETLAWAMVGQSSRLNDLLWQIDKASATQVGVVITGERGTGRGLVARTIHACNAPAGTHFVSVYCDKHEAGDIEYALFGNVSRHTAAQARTGADTRPAGSPEAAGGGNGHAGVVECIAEGSLLHKARGGTLYLRHLEEMPERVQARLSHLFRDGEAFVGSSDRSGRDAEPFEMRPILAADTDFPASVADGRVRLDLYRRLARVCIELPPLRERRDDIPALVAHFAEKACRAEGKAVKTLSPSAITVLSALPWRGNARELEATIQALVTRVNGAEIHLPDVLAQLRLDDYVERPRPEPYQGETLRVARERFEREYVAAVLAQCRGRIPDAARALGIQRTNLYRKIRALHVPRNGASAERVSDQ